MYEIPEDFNLDQMLGSEVTLIRVSLHVSDIHLDPFQFSIENGYTLKLQDGRTEKWGKDDLVPVPTLLTALIGKSLERWHVDKRSSIYLQFSGGISIELTTDNPYFECLVISFGIDGDPQYVI